MAASIYPSTGLYSGKSTASLVHCFVEVDLRGLEASIQLSLLFQNTHEYDMEDVVFHCKFDSEDAAMNSFSCRVERTQPLHPKLRFERRMMKMAVKNGSMFQCYVGHVPSGCDAVVFISWSTIIAPVEDTIALSLPLPSKAEELGIFACSLLPGAIRGVHSSSHRIDAQIQGNYAQVEFDTPKDERSDNLELTFIADNLSNSAALADLDMWDADYGSDSDSESDYDEDMGGGGPITHGLDFKSPYEAGTGDGYEDNNPTIFPGMPWNNTAVFVATEKETDQELLMFEEQVHYRCLSHPPAQRQHPFPEKLPAFHANDEQSKKESELGMLLLQHTVSPQDIKSPTSSQVAPSLGLGHDYGQDLGDVDS